MQCNDVSMSIRVFIVSDIKDGLYRILTVKSEKKIIVPQLHCLEDNAPFVGDIPCAITITVYRFYIFNLISLKTGHNKEFRHFDC